MTQITAQELKEILKSQADIHLLDVRNEDERAICSIGGVHIPLAAIQNFQTDAIDDWADEPIYVYCRSGNRSVQAIAFLEQAGFKNLINIQGGINAYNELVD